MLFCYRYLGDYQKADIGLQDIFRNDVKQATVQKVMV